MDSIPAWLPDSSASYPAVAGTGTTGSPECHEPRRLFALRTAQGSLHGGLEVVVISTGETRLQNNRMPVRALPREARWLAWRIRMVKRARAGHAEPTENLNLLSLPAQLGDHLISLPLRRPQSPHPNPPDTRPVGLGGDRYQSLTLSLPTRHALLQPAPPWFHPPPPITQAIPVSAAYTRLSGASFQSSHTQSISGFDWKACSWTARLAGGFLPCLGIELLQTQNA